jgi:hypothetical protein
MQFLATVLTLLVVLFAGQVASEASATTQATQARPEAHGSYLRRLCLLPGCGSSHSSSESSGSESDGTNARSGGFDSTSQGPSRTTSLLAYFVSSATVVALFGAAYIRRRRVR